MGRGQYQNPFVFVACTHLLAGVLLVFSGVGSTLLRFVLRSLSGMLAPINDDLFYLGKVLDKLSRADNLTFGKTGSLPNHRWLHNRLQPAVELRAVEIQQKTS